MKTQEMPHTLKSQVHELITQGFRETSTIHINEKFKKINLHNLHK